MKKVVILLLTIVISACVKLPDPSESITVRISSKLLNANSGSNGILITSNYSNPNNFKLASYGICWTIDNTEPTVKSNVTSINLASNNVFAVQLTELQMDKTYRLKPFVKTTNGGVVYGLSEEITTPSVSTISASSIKANTAIITGNVSKPGSYTILDKGVVYATTPSPKVTDTKRSTGNGTGIFSIELSNLTHNTTYYARAYIMTSESAFYGPEINFKTLEISAPVLKTNNATFITLSSAVVSGEVESDGNSAIIERGIVYSTTQNPTTSNTKIISYGGIGIFSVNLTSLISNTTYYVRTFARNSIFTGYGPQISFKTLQISTPVLTTNSPTFVTSSGAVVSGSVEFDGNSPIIERGVVYANTQNPTTSNSKIVNGSGLGQFSVNITSLISNTTYYARTFAKNNTYTGYGPQVSFKTDPLLATVGIDNISSYSITSNSVYISGSIISNGNEIITEKGFVISENAVPTTSDRKINAGSGTSSFYSTIDNLKPFTKYYIRSYAVSIVGTAYSVEKSFQTLGTTATVSTTITSNITSNSAVLGGNISSNNGSTVTERGIYYSSTYSNPYNYGTKVIIGSGDGLFSKEITNLNPKTKYYYVAYAKNTYGTNTGSVQSFTTASSIASLSINSPYTILSNSATMTVNILSSGGESLTEKGVVYGTTSAPTVNNSKVQSISIYSSFDITISNLEVATKYYARGYAINSVGIAYGNEINFTTLGTRPSISTTYASNITGNSAIIGGNISSINGSSVTDRGIYLSMNNADPYNYGSKISIGTGEGLFSKEVSNLNPNSKYYFVAYATNSYGTNLGSTLSFTTTSTTATLTTGTPSSITSSGASISVNITSTGGEAILEKGIVYGKTSSPTLSDSKVQSSSTSNSYSLNLSGLDFATKYYVRGYAINSAGTSFGNEVNFTTLATLPTVTTSPASNITTRDANISCEVKDDGGGTVTERGVVYSTYQNPTTSGSKVTAGSGNGVYSAKVSPLSANTTYYARAYAINSAGTAYGQQIAFTTEQIKVPTLSTGNASDITAHTVNIPGTITNDGGGTISARGIQISTSSTFASNVSTHVATIDANSAFTKNITNLTHNTQYYARAYATNSAGSGVGNIVSFNTENATTALITTLSTTNIGTITATCSGTITSNGNSPITEVGIIYYSNSSYLFNYGTKIKATVIQTGNYSVNLTGLNSNQLYYFAAYAINNVGTKYGTILSFRTSAPTLATLTTNAVSILGSNSAILGGNITDEGNSSVSSRGVVYSTTANPTYNNNKVIIGSGSGLFSQTVTSFIPNTTYYARAFAHNTAGYAYGNQVTFTTPTATPATITTFAAKDITYNSVTLGGNLTSEGNSNVTDKGVVYSMLQNPSITNATKISKGSGTGSYEAQISNLNSNTIYYARAYATNSYGTVYGSQISFTTELAPPVFSSTTYSSNYGNVTLYSTISSVNTYTITERGFVYSRTNNNPSVSDSKVSAGTGTGSFSANISSLNRYTSYFYRAYIITNKGTFYSSISTFYTN